MKTLFITLLAFVFFNNTQLFGQENQDDVTLTVIGEGLTIEKAKLVALRSAIEQAFGAFISSRTEILNDELINDEITSVSSGNIKSYEVLNETQFPDGKWVVNLKAIVSVNKLTSFVKSKGIEVEINGGLFALNIKQQKLNEEGEVNTISEMLGLLHEPMQIAFDYSIETSDPYSANSLNSLWDIPLTVKAISNKNMDFCADYCIKTLSALSLSKAEIESYNNLNKKIFPVQIRYNGQTHKYYLRKEISSRGIIMIAKKWKDCINLFTIYDSGKEERFNKKGDYNLSFSTSNYLKFPTSGVEVATFRFIHRKSLSQLEKTTGYSIKPKGVVSFFKHGGIVLTENNGHGLVISVMDLTPIKVNYYTAYSTCDNLVLNGYDDWRLPLKEELSMYLISGYNSEKIVGLYTGGYHPYWTNSEVPKGQYGRGPIEMYRVGGSNAEKKSSTGVVRAVRTF